MIHIESTCLPEVGIPKPRGVGVESEREKPLIESEEDLPFNISAQPGTAVPQDIPTLIKLKDQEHSHDVEDFKNVTGKHILYGCLFAMAVAALADSVWHIESAIFTSAFEVAKVVATTILGYLFGSKAK